MDIDVTLESMSGKEDWLLRPVLRGILKYESLLDGTVSLYDIDLLNEALDVEDVNKMLVTEAVHNANKS